MQPVSRARLAMSSLAILILGAGVAGYIGVSKLGYPTVATDSDESSSAGQVEPVAGSDIPRVILTADAARRIGLQTAAFTATVVNGHEQLSIPYAAVYYDPSGRTWTYVAVESLVFRRQNITVVSIEGAVAILSAGPPAGASVVTVGSAQLYGTEVGVQEG